MEATTIWLKAQIKEIISNKPDVKSMYDFLQRVRSAYTDGAIADPDAVKETLISIWQNVFDYDQSELIEYTNPDDTRVIVDTAPGSEFSQSTMDFIIQNINLPQDTIALTCYNGLSRSMNGFRQLQKELSSPIPDENLLVINDITGSQHTGFGSLLSLGLQLSRFKKSGVSIEHLKIFFFNNKDNSELKGFVERVLRLFQELTLDQVIDILLGDFTPIGIEELYIIQKRG